MIKRIGLISDTHGELATPVLEIFANTDAIIHAGDIGDPDILGELQKLAPVTAVMGNVDDQFTFPQLKDEAMYRDKQFACLVRHIVLDPVSHYLQLKRNSHYSNAAAIIFGHTHVPWQKRIGPYLYVNPGSPHRPREGHNPSVAILEYDGDGYCHAHHHYVSR